MSYKIRLGEPVVIDRGPTWDNAGWGPYQFPNIYRLPDGRLLAGYNVVLDRCEDYGLERGWAVSEDNAQSWRVITPEEAAPLKPQTGLKLPDGTFLRSITNRPIALSEELYAELSKKTHPKGRSIPAEDIPDGLLPKYTWPYAKYDPETGKEDVYRANLDFPGMTYFLTTGALVDPFPYCVPRLAPDGTIWQPQYAHGRNPENLGFTCYYACYYFQSTDGGKSFQLKSWIQYRPDTNDFPEAFEIKEGFCEPDIAFMPDGSMITLMRSSGTTPSYLCRSADGGHTWDTPVMFDKCGVMPHLLHLNCGVTLASYGRPGLFLRATDDPSGMKWDEPIELKPYLKGYPDFISHTCAYTDMIALDDRTAVLVYSDFDFPDSAGVARKTLVSRIITIEEV